MFLLLIYLQPFFFSLFLLYFSFPLSRASFLSSPLPLFYSFISNILFIYFLPMSLFPPSIFLSVFSFLCLV
jgi:hypothetical protein